MPRRWNDDFVLDDISWAWGEASTNATQVESTPAEIEQAQTEITPESPIDEADTGTYFNPSQTRYVDVEGQRFIVSDRMTLPEFRANWYTYRSGARERDLYEMERQVINEQERQAQSRRELDAQEREHQIAVGAASMQELAEGLDWSNDCQCEACYTRRNPRTIDPYTFTSMSSTRSASQGEPRRDSNYFICASCRQSCRRTYTDSRGRNRSSIQSVFNNHTVCRECWENNELIRSCEFCGTQTMVDDIHRDDVSGQSWCGNCFEHYGTHEGQRRCRRCEARFDENLITENGECNNCRRRNLIHSYDTNVMAFCSMIGEPKDRLYFGVELEVEATGIDRLEAAERMQNAIQGFGILKRDGSLSESGIEVVSAPIAFDEYYSGMWDRFFTKETLEGLRSFKTDTCGMHVHVSRAPLTKLQIGKMVAFVHNPANKEFIEKIAQRPSNYYGDFARFKTETEILRDVSDRNNRYTALNLRNPHTIEFRIFKGTINRETFLKNLEFCHALVKFCGGTSRSLGEAADARLFAAYVFQERKRYPHLWSFMGQRNMMPNFRNVYELKDYIKKIGRQARKTYLDERAKNRLINGVSSVRGRNMDYYRGVTTGRTNGFSLTIELHRYSSEELYDMMRNLERETILNSVRSSNLSLDEIPTPENVPDASVWGNCDCEYCQSSTEWERQYEAERVEFLRQRYAALCITDNVEGRTRRIDNSISDEQMLS